MEEMIRRKWRRWIIEKIDIIRKKNFKGKTFAGKNFRTEEEQKGRERGQVSWKMVTDMHMTRHMEIEE